MGKKPDVIRIIGETDDSIVREGWRILLSDGVHAFNSYLKSVKGSLSPTGVGVMYFTRAEYKLITCDPGVHYDIEQAVKSLPKPLELSNRFGIWMGDDPSLVRLIRPKLSSLTNYRKSLRKSQAPIQHVAKNPSMHLYPQVAAAETYYMQGDIEKALEIIAPVYENAETNNLPVAIIYAGFVLLRCAVYRGDVETFHRVLDKITATAKTRRHMYGVLRLINGWIDATTGYMGKTPRYTMLPTGVQIPNHDARVARRRDFKIKNQIVWGIMPESLADKELVPIFEVSTLVYHAMMFSKYNEEEEAARLFMCAFNLTRENHIFSPYFEYGEQIVPLLQDVLGRYPELRWQKLKLIEAAKAYEVGLLRIRKGKGNGNGMKRVGLPDGVFTPMELTIFRMICDGKSNAEIIEGLKKSRSSVARHIQHIVEKMGLKTKDEAIEKARNQGYFE